MEIWDILDINGRKIGKTTQKGQRLKEGQYHLVVHIWIFNSKGETLIQKRADHLNNLPGLWAVTGGSVIQGEDSLTAIKRETKEELGIHIQPKPGPIRYQWRNILTDIWLAKKDIDLKDMVLQKEEVSDAKWVSQEKLKQMIAKGEFHRYEKEYFETMKKYWSKYL